MSTLNVIFQTGHQSGKARYVVQNVIIYLVVELVLFFGCFVFCNASFLFVVPFSFFFCNTM